jgi:uncharacterized protein (TIGR02421 family)
MNIQAEKQHIKQVCDLMHQASLNIRILGHIAWPSEVRDTFFKYKESQLPVIEYPSFDPTENINILSKASALLGNNTIDDWLGQKVAILEKSSLLLASAGTADFYQYSTQLYGKPDETLPDERTNSIGLANELINTLSSFDSIDIGAPSPACYLADGLATEMQDAVKNMFGNRAPQVEVVEELSANALASPSRIRIRKGACFTDNDIQQLIQHEAYIHVATSLNGLDQENLKILSFAHPGTTKTQEGLAVFAEVITGTMDISRMSRLANRVIAIQMAIDGADFIQVYRYFIDITDSKEQAFENARRVFRGGTLTGGAPFTKDIVYLDGLLRVHSFLQALVVNGRADCLRLLFCGKLDIEDIPILGWMTASGICKPATFLPPWAKDMRFLLSFLAYNSFVGQVKFKRVKNHYEKMLQDVPKLD